MVRRHRMSGSTTVGDWLRSRDRGHTLGTGGLLGQAIGTLALALEGVEASSGLPLLPDRERMCLA